MRSWRKPRNPAHGDGDLFERADPARCRAFETYLPLQKDWTAIFFELEVSRRYIWHPPPLAPQAIVDLVQTSNAFHNRYLMRGLPRWRNII